MTINSEEKTVTIKTHSEEQSVEFNPRLISFYLPQFHPIPENDQWWGKGFTEWTNVTQAKPLFDGHYQPHLPADLGFYDLRLAEVRQAQTDLAKEHGIYGFCYYHYWFNGKQVLERPFNEVLKSGQPDFPFCLCWANENWTRRWDGQDKEILLEQIYTEEDDYQHINYLVEAFRDPRYIRVEGKPLFLVYRANQMLNPLKTTEIWRKEAERLEIGEIFLCRVESFLDEHKDPKLIGFDAAVEFQPDWNELANLQLQRGNSWDIARKFNLANPAYVNNNIYDYQAVIKKMLGKKSPPYPRFPCVTPSWDNTARRKAGATIFKDSTPELYEYWLKSVIEKMSLKKDLPPLIFVNAWNEWAEGNHLEPCQKWGTGYLEATQRAIKSVTAKSII